MTPELTNIYYLNRSLYLSILNQSLQVIFSPLKRNHDDFVIWKIRYGSCAALLYITLCHTHIYKHSLSKFKVPIRTVITSLHPKVFCRFKGVFPCPVTLEDRIDELSGRDVVGIEADQPHDEDTIVTEIVLGEIFREVSVPIVTNSIHQGQVLLDITEPVCLRDGADGPGQKTKGAEEK